MGSWRKVGAFLGLVPDENLEYSEADEFDDEPRGSRLRQGRDYGDFDGPSYGSRDDRDSYRPEPAYRPEHSGRRSFASEPVTQGALAVKPDLMPRRDPEAATSVSRPATVKLTGFAEARIIGEKYRDGQPVILDMTDMSDSDARRLVDFSAGLAFSLRGSIDRVAPKVFMLLPPDADVAAAAQAAGYGSTPSWSGR